MTDFATAECAIRQLQARCIDAVWRKDADGFAACFTPDGEWKIAGQHKRGRAEVAALFAALLGRCERVVTMAGTPVLEVDGDTAFGRTQVVEHSRLLDGQTAMTSGIYFERFVRTDEGWRFAWRHWSLKYRGPADLTGTFYDTPDYGPPPGMPEPEETTATSLK